MVPSLKSSNTAKRFLLLLRETEQLHLFSHALLALAHGRNCLVGADCMAGHIGLEPANPVRALHDFTMRPPEREPAIVGMRPNKRQEPHFTI